jgi:hypothetical protein
VYTINYYILPLHSIDIYSKNMIGLSHYQQGESCGGGEFGAVQQRSGK